MLKRNATWHLLLVVSILVFIFIIVGYSLRKRADSVGLEPDIVDASQSAPGSLSPSAGASPSGGSLRPGAADAGALDSDDLAGWIPSARSEDLALTPPVRTGSPVSPPPVSTSQSGVITGLVPGGPTDGGASSSSMRPPSGTPADTGGLQLPSDLVDSGSSPSASDDSSFLASLPIGGGSLAPPSSSSTPGYSSGTAPSQSGASLAPPPAETSGGSLLPPPDSSGASGLVPPPPAAEASSSAAGYSTDDDDEEDEIIEEWDTDDQEPMGSGLTPPPASGGRLAPPPPAGTGRQTPPPVGMGRQTPPPPPPGHVAPPLGNESPSESLRIYVVRPGDTLSNIASRELGSSSLADNIFLLNRDVIDDPDHLLIGAKIRLPYANPDPVPGLPDQTRRPTQGLGRTHIVARGDTLSSIAMQYYGTSAGWRFLFEANKHLLPNPNQLSVGMELSIPPYEQ